MESSRGGGRRRGNCAPSCAHRAGCRSSPCGKALSLVSRAPQRCAVRACESGCASRAARAS
eukprot:3096071-Prymnesium_polylepis.1